MATVTTAADIPRMIEERQSVVNGIPITSGGESTVIDPANTIKPVKDGTDDKSKAKKDEDPGDDDDGGEEDGSEVKKKGKVSSRIQQLVRQREEADEFAESEYNARIRAEARIKELEEKNAADKPKEKGKADDDTGKPKPEDYEKGDEAKYWEDLAEWKAKKAIERDRREQAELRVKSEAEAEAKEVLEAYNGRVAEFKKTQPDFTEVVEENADMRIAEALRDAILDSENGPLLTYHLATHPSTLTRLNKLRPRAAVYELGRLEERLTAKPEGEAPKEGDKPAKGEVKVNVQKSSAPAPITPVKGGESNVDKNPANMNFQEYKAARKAGRIT